MYAFCTRVLLVSSVCLIVRIESSVQNSGTTGLTPECNYHKTDFGILTGRVIWALEFFENYVSELVLDAAVGTRILQDQLALTLKDNLRLPTKIREFLQKLQRKSETITRSILTNIKTSQAISNEEKWNTIPWITTPLLMESPELYKWKTFSINVTENTLLMEDLDLNKPEVMNETVSDACIGSLFETCQVSEECSKLFLAKPLVQYSLTHQVIYMLIAKQRGCLSDPEFQQKVGPNNGDRFLEQLCSKVWVESNFIARMNFPMNLRDLFTEQVVVCSLGGFEQFLSRDWLQTILTWQSANSKCFPIFEDEDEETENNPVTSNNNIRTKRSDAFVEVNEDETCSAHFTALGIAAMGIHIRKLLEGCLN